MVLSQMKAAKYVVEAKGLQKTYPGGRKALRGLDFLLGKGERVALMGPNGAGKTTLVKIIAGLLLPDSGELRLFGAPFSHRAMKHLGFLFEEANNLYGYMTVWENMMFYGRLAGIAEGRLPSWADELLQQFDLSSNKRQLAQSLSRGQKQKVALASVLVQDAEVLILDEPTLGMDLPSQQDLMQRIKGLETVLITTHDPVLAWEVADRFVVINQGELRGSYSRDDLITMNVTDATALRNWLLEVYE